MWSKTQVTFSWQCHVILLVKLHVSFFTPSALPWHHWNCTKEPAIYQGLINLQTWTHLYWLNQWWWQGIQFTNILSAELYSSSLRILLQFSTRPALHQIKKTKRAKDEVIVKWSLTLTTLLPDIYVAVSWKPASFRIIWRNKMCYNPSLNITGFQTCMRSQIYN